MSERVPVEVSEPGSPEAAHALAVLHPEAVPRPADPFERDAEAGFDFVWPPGWPW